MSGDVHVRFCERLEGRFLRPTRLVLNGLTVVGTGVFISSGQIASVTYTTATNGSQITDFTCTNGRGLAITVTGSGSTAVWSWRCM